MFITTLHSYHVNVNLVILLIVCSFASMIIEKLYEVIIDISKRWWSFYDVLIILRQV
jgi:S-adenosylmethionine:tRNA-ribosyltransferase-isomerase (queuine synthetase)